MTNEPTLEEIISSRQFDRGEKVREHKFTFDKNSSKITMVTANKPPIPIFKLNYSEIESQHYIKIRFDTVFLYGKIVEYLFDGMWYIDALFDKTDFNTELVCKWDAEVPVECELSIKVDDDIVEENLVTMKIIGKMIPLEYSIFSISLSEKEI